MQTGDRLVLAQVVALAGTAWPGPSRWHLPGGVAVVARLALVSGCALAAAGLAAQGGQLTPRVTPPPSADLLTSGPYSVSRHPVYAGLLVASAAVAVLRRRPEPLVAWMTLAGVLHVKSGVEELHLHDRFGDAYARYAARTPRLIGPPTW